MGIEEIPYSSTTPEDGPDAPDAAIVVFPTSNAASTSCPECGVAVNFCRGLTGGESTPPTDTLSLCGDCGGLAAWDGNGNLRALSDGELFKIYASSQGNSIKSLQADVRSKAIKL